MLNNILDQKPFEGQLEADMARKFFAKVYAFMFGALLVSAAVTYQYGTLEFFTKYFLNEAGNPNILYYVVIFAPLGVSFALQALINKASFAVLFALFAVYAVLIGFAISSIMLKYSGASIAATFGITAVTFAIMAIAGYVTKTDLTKFGSILGMAFVGIIIASIVNVFLGWETLSFIISAIGVLVFTGLTAFHMQRLKHMAHDAELDEQQRNKLALLGGFTLYVLFINLFLSLLRLFGSRD